MSNGPDFDVTATGDFLGGGIGLATAAMISIIWYVFQVIAYWKMFNKFGEPGWKSIIPIYNSYIVYKATWNVKMFFINILMAVLLALRSMDGTVFYTIAGIGAVGVIVIEIMKKNKISKAFGHGFGFTLGLLFFDPIFKLILGFGSSKYIGNPTK